MWSKTSLWLGLAAVGQWASLQLIDAGPRIHFQHYFAPVDWMRGDRRSLAALLLALQAMCVVAALASRVLPFLRGLAGHFGWWRIVLAAALSAVTSAALSPQPGQLIVEIAIATTIQLVALGNIILAVAGLSGVPWTARLQRWFGQPGESGVEPARGIDAWTAIGAIAVTAVAAGLCYFVYRNHPHIPDEVGYILHARYLAQGMLTMPAPPIPDGFFIDLMMLDSGRWFCPMPPGWPMVLMMGAEAGVRWLVNPVLAGLNVWIAWLLLREVYSPRTARLVILLLCASPWFVFMSMNFMTHTLLMTVATAALLGVARARRTGKVGWACLAGVAIGCATLIRPLDGMIAGLLAGMWAIGWGGVRLKFSHLAALGATAMLVGAAILPYNAHLTGDLWKNPIMVYFDRTYHVGANSLGFGPDRGLGWALDAWPGHTPLEAGVNALLNGFSVNIELHGWSIGSLWAVALAALSARSRRADRACLAAIATVIACYSAYYFHGGPEFGARYWYQALLPLLVLSVRGLEHLEEALGSARPLAGALALTTLAAAIYLPWRMVDKYPSLLFMRPDVRTLTAEHHFGRSLVLVRGQAHPDYASAATYNPLDLRPESSADAPIYVWDRDEATRAKALQLYADRPVWILEGPTLTGGGFRIAQSPAGAGRP